MADMKIFTEDEVQALLEKELPEWELRDGWIRRKYKTPGFAHTLMLVNTVGYLAEAANHHPDLEVGYAQLIVKLQTHSERAITSKDTELALKIESTVLWQPAEDSTLDGFPKRWIH